MAMRSLPGAGITQVAQSEQGEKRGDDHGKCLHASDRFCCTGDRDENAGNRIRS